jgi:hypothetical protein
MSRSTVRRIFLIGLAIWIVGLVLFGGGFLGGHPTTVQSGSSGYAPGNSALSGIGLALMAIGGIIDFVAWIGALIGTAQLGRWGWFVALLVLGLIGLLLIVMIVYVIAGPTERREVTASPAAT